MTVKTTVRLNGMTYDAAEDVVQIIDMMLSEMSENTGRMPVETTDHVDHKFVIETENVDLTHTLESILRTMLPYFGARSFTVDRWARYEARDQNGDVLASANSWGLIATEFADWLKGADESNHGAGIIDTYNDEWCIRFLTKEND